MNRFFQDIYTNERALCLCYTLYPTYLFALGYYYGTLHSAAWRWRLFPFFGSYFLRFYSANCGVVLLVMICIALFMLLLCIFGCPYLFMSISV